MVTRTAAHHTTHATRTTHPRPAATPFKVADFANERVKISRQPGISTCFAGPTVLTSDRGTITFGLSGEMPVFNKGTRGEHTLTPQEAVDLRNGLLSTSFPRSAHQDVKDVVNMLVQLSTGGGGWGP